jgi:alkyl hydroperoxide reductase subunit F
MTNSQNDVAIYTTPSCQYCKKTKAFFDENDISYTEYDVSEDQEKRQEMVEKSGQMGVPVTIIGDEIITGFDEDKLREELNL